MFNIEIEQLILPSIIIAIATYFISYLATRSVGLSSVAMLIKAGYFFCYFGYVFDGSQTFFDDITYLDSGIIFAGKGINFLNLYEEWQFVKSVVGGSHVGYDLINCLAVYMFGAKYYAPVIINNLLTLPIAYLGSRLTAKEFGLNTINKKMFYAFLLFHPDIFAWSSMFNLKDISVLLLHVTLIYSVSLYFRRRIRLSLLIGSISILFVSTLRFYVPLLMIIALVSSIFITKKIRYRLLYIIICLGFLATIIFGIGSGLILDSIERIKSSPTDAIFGIIKICLTPIPFHTEQSYSFLNLPALIHWILIPFTLLGILQVKKINTSFSIFFLIYLLLFIFLYGIFEELQGPRHRVQLDYAIATLQFIGILNALNRYSVKPRYLVPTN